MFKYIDYDNFKRELFKQNIKIEREVNNLIENTSESKNHSISFDDEITNLNHNINVENLHLKTSFPAKQPTLQSSCIPALSPRVNNSVVVNNNASESPSHSHIFNLQRKFENKMLKPTLKASLMKKQVPSLLPPLVKLPRF